MAVVNREIYQQFGIQETDGRLARRVQRDRIYLFFSTNVVHVISKKKNDLNHFLTDDWT